MFSAEPQFAPESPVLRYARDVKAHHTLHPLVAARAELRGLLTGRRASGSIHFYDLRDTTGPIQVVARRDALSEEAWAAATALRMNDLVSVRGRVFTTARGELSVELSESPVVRAKNLEKAISEGELEYSRVGSQILAARLRQHAGEFFRGTGYVEIEPSLLSLSWGPDGLEPLEVKYPGFGTAAFLTPSPSPQLLDAIVATGVERAFAISRCFSTTYRDEKSSAQSLILVAKRIGATPEAQREVLERAIIAILGGWQTLPEEFELLLRDWTRSNAGWPPTGGAEPRKSAAIEIYENPSPLGGTAALTSVREISRAIWPPDRVIGESVVEMLEGGFEMGTCTLHLERMGSLLRDVPIRQLRQVDRMSGALANTGSASGQAS
jgi:hypothetical protein